MSIVIKAELVKKLRDKTSVSMMECKRALEQTNGDLEAAVDLLRKLGEATAVKKQSRIAAEGLVVVSNEKANKIAVLEVNCETDFVAKNNNLVDFANKVVKIILNTETTDLVQLNDQIFSDNMTVEQARLILVTQLGENIVLRRAKICSVNQNQVASYYLHGSVPHKIASVICLEGGNENLARDIAMHVAAMRPEYLNITDIPEARKVKEQEIFLEQTMRENSGKPPEILQKIVAGRVNSFFKDITLVKQSYIKDPSVTIEALLDKNKAKIINMLRIEVGEGIDKSEN